jgi:Flp pilus assembly CpaE family ATPase
MNGISHMILMIDGSPDYANLVQAWIAGASGEMMPILTRAETLEAGLRLVEQGGVDLILLELNLPDSSGFNTFAIVRANAPAIPVVVLCTCDTEAITLQTIHEGAEDYIIRNECGPELLVRVVESAIVRHKARISKSEIEIPSTRTRVIGVLGAVGGAGTTTVACNMADELRILTGEKVLLADLNLQAGLVSFTVGLPNTTFSLRDAVANLHRLDQSCWDKMVSRTTTDLHILPSPDLLGADDLPPEAISGVLDRLKPFYQWIVLDLGRLNACSMALLPNCNQTLVVTTTAVPALYGAILTVAALKATGIEKAQLSLILNRISQEQPLSASEIYKLFGVQIGAMLSADPGEMEKACNQKRLPAENSVFRREISFLVRKVAGLPAAAAKRRFWPFLKQAQRLRDDAIADLADAS